MKPRSVQVRTFYTDTLASTDRGLDNTSSLPRTVETQVDESTENGVFPGLQDIFDDVFQAPLDPDWFTVDPLDLMSL